MFAGIGRWISGLWRLG